MNQLGSGYVRLVMAYIKQKNKFSTENKKLGTVVILVQTTVTVKRASLGGALLIKF